MKAFRYLMLYSLLLSLNVTIYVQKHPAIAQEFDHTHALYDKIVATHVTEGMVWSVDPDTLELRRPFLEK